MTGYTYKLINLGSLITREPMSDQRKDKHRCTVINICLGFQLLFTYSYVQYLKSHLGSKDKFVSLKETSGSVDIDKVCNAINEVHYTVLHFLSWFCSCYSIGKDCVECLQKVWKARHYTKSKGHRNIIKTSFLCFHLLPIILHFQILLHCIAWHLTSILCMTSHITLYYSITRFLGTHLEQR